MKGRDGSLTVGVKVVINLFRDSFAYPGHAFELAETGTGHCSRRTEMMQQRLFAADTDPADLVERGSAEGLGPLGSVGANRKAMRLVTQTVQEIEDRIAGAERERRAA